MNRIAALALMLCGLAAAAPARADDPALAAPIEQCIRQNASQVAAAIPDLSQAVDFLVGKLCAEPVARESARAMNRRSERNAARMKEFCDKQKPAPAGGKPDDKNQPLNLASICAMQNIGFTAMASVDEDDDALPAYMGVTPPGAVALAARLLLDLRLAHASR